MEGKTPLIVGVSGLILSGAISCLCLVNDKMPPEKFSVAMQLASTIAGSSLAGIFGYSIQKHDE